MIRPRRSSRCPMPRGCTLQESRARTVLHGRSATGSIASGSPRSRLSIGGSAPSLPLLKGRRVSGAKILVGSWRECAPIAKRLVASAGALPLHFPIAKDGGRPPALAPRPPPRAAYYGRSAARQRHVLTSQDRLAPPLEHHAGSPPPLEERPQPPARPWRSGDSRHTARGHPATRRWNSKPCPYGAARPWCGAALSQ